MSGSNQGGGTSWVTYAVVGSTAAIAVAGLGYLAYSAWNDAESEDPAPAAADETAAARLKIARGIQMQSLASSQPTTSSPTLPVRPTPKANGTSKPTATKAPSAASGGRKMCAQCGKPTSGLPLRCSGCKQVYYCSQECQRKAWPEHKTSCKSSSSGGASQPSASASGTGPSQPAAAAQEPSGTPSKDTTAAEEPKDFQSALAMYLEQQATANTDQLEASFETAVMLFVKGEYRAAITQLERVKEMSIERGNKGVQGEVYKWMGHAYNRLSEPSKAQVMFEEGSAYAKQNKLTRLEIDCLGGLGCMYRAQNNTDRAVALLEEALGLAEVCKDEDSKASTLCNLGAALMQVDPKRALNCLHEAVTIREMAIERIHDSGERNGLATAVMEHANALVNLASALLVTKHLPEAEMCYVRALDVFELVEDVDKVCKVLINLANMKELQIGTAKARQEAVVYRKKLIDFMAAHGVRRVDSACSICLEPFDMQAANLEEGQELILLSCLHCLHNKCWEQWAAKDTADGPVTCPTCKQPVPLYEG